MKYLATVDGRDYEIDLERPGELALGGRAVAVDLRAIGGSQLYSLLLDQRSYEVFVERVEGRYYVMIAGDRFVVDVEEARLKQLKAMGGQAHVDHDTATIAAPMPGLVIKVLAQAGDWVEEDQGLLILEAMKMENEIRSPRAGRLRSMSASTGQAVSLGDVLAVVEAGEA